MSLELLKTFLVANRKELIKLPLAPFGGLGIVFGSDYELDFDIHLPANEIPEVKFSSINADLIIYLRYLVQTNNKHEAVDTWAETLLRYAEIRKVLPKRLIYHGCASYKCAAQLLVAFFLEYYAARSDLRFLNITLKMNDVSNNKRKMRLHINENVENLFMARNALLETYFMERI